MVDAADNDLLLTAKKVSPVTLYDSSAEPYSAERCTSEDSTSVRCLSPVLNSNNSHRKLIYNRRRGRTKSRVKLTKRFASLDGVGSEKDKTENTIVAGYKNINKTISDIQILESSGVEDRLAKISELEKEKKKFSEILYAAKETKTYMSDSKPYKMNFSDEFNFKKPVSPVSGLKKFKPSVDVLLQDRKLGQSSTTNASNSNANLRNLNGSFETDRRNVRNEKKNVENFELKCKGFCTGSGKSIVISPESFRKNLELFGDILDINNETKSDSYLDCLVESSKKENIQIQNEKVALKSNTLDQVENFTNPRRQTLDKHELHHPKDISFMQTSISDTQMVLAADIAMSMMDVVAKDDWAVAAPSTNKIVNLDNTNKNKGQISFSNILPTAAKQIFNVNEEPDTTVEHEMFELEKILSKDIGIAGNYNKSGSITLQNDMKFTNLSKVEKINKMEQIYNVYKEVSNKCNEKNNFKGFAIHEYDFSQQLCNNHTKCIEKFETVIEYYNKSVTSKNEEQGIAPFMLEANRGTSSNLQQTIEIKMCNKNGKHFLNDSDIVPNKRFKFDNTLNTNLGKDESSFDCGFKTASKKPIKMSSSSMKKAQRIYKQVCKTETKTESSSVYDQSDAFRERKENIELAITAEITDTRDKSLKFDLMPLNTNNNIITTFGETNCAINVNDFSDCGFKTASKKPIKMLPSSLKKAQRIFEQACQAENPTESNETNQKSLLKKAEEKQLEAAFTSSSLQGFSTAGGKTIKVSNEALHKGNAIFASEELTSLPSKHKNQFGKPTMKDDDVVSLNGENSTNVTHSKTLTNISNLASNSGSVPALQVPGINSHQKNVKKEGVSHTFAAGFTTGSGTKIKVSNDALRKGEALLAEDLSLSVQHEEVKDLIESTNAKTVHGPAEIDLPQRAKKVFNESSSMEDLNNEEQSLRKSYSDSYHRNTVNRTKSTDCKQKFFDSPVNSTKIGSAKKRLGLSVCRQISISNDKLQKAKSLFAEDLDSNQSGSSRNSSMSTPIRFKQPEIHSSTPLKEIGAFKNSPVETIKGPQIIKANTLDSIDITPVKRPCFKDNIEKTKSNEDQSAIVMQEQTEGNTEKWLEKIAKEYEDLEYKMKVLLERKAALELQRQLIDNADDEHRRQKPGILLKKKQLSQRISLKQLCENQKPGSASTNEAVDLVIPKQVLEVTPRNAEYVHFNCAWPNNCEKYPSTLCTADGAVVVPNSDNLIGLSEIKAAFEAMPGTDPKLLPKGWISNHFKWIVWKLASLERNFPDLFPNCLSVENVMQQLKYRYDREIDQAERPALRRILEKDDVPQKRMILCVADIIKVTDNVFELELTDGWYCVRTVIDQPLCNKISASKIVIGTKLIVQCAEILNCDGCHPLDVPDLVRLKINYNCTRRAAWYSILGYQRAAEPFPIRLKTILSDGGLIGYIKIYIARVYSLRYMERQAGRAVWRNKKAEEKRSQEWTNQRMKEMEMIHHKVQEDYEKEMNGVQKDYMMGRLDCGKISEINSPKLLYQMLENANDPEGIKNMMSPSQIASAMEYRSNIYVHHQQEVASRIANQVKNLKSSHREVVSVLKLRVVEASEYSEDSFIFNIWKPTEEHLQLLKEGCTFSVYNVFPKQNGDLTANSRTHFKPEPPLSLKNNRMQRHVLPISALQNLLHEPPLFNEYDTVGTVVEIHKDTHCQELWLTDSLGRLLYVKIFEGPEQCCLLENVNRGQSIAIMNLIFRPPQDTFGQALANQCTVVTGYPQHKFLQDGLNAHCEQLSKNLTSLLNECDKKIEMCITKMQATRSTTSLIGSFTTSEHLTDLFDDSSEDNTVIPSRLTTTDVAMSLIDTDQYFENG